MSHELLGAPESLLQSEFRRIRLGGVSWIREDLPWALVEPERGVFDWRALDELIEAASVTGVHVLGILDYSAPWASSDPSGKESVFYPPKSDADFASYARAVALRYGPNGSFLAEHPSVATTPLRALEIWNEPFGYRFWKPGPDPVAYDALVRATAPAIHAADPSMTVLMSADLQSENSLGEFNPWFTQLLAIDPGITKLVNALDVHPYPDPWNTSPFEEGQESFGRVQLIHHVEQAAGVALPIWITEIGWSSPPETAYGVSEQTQASFLCEAVVRSMGQWGSFVGKIFLFSWDRSSGLANDREHNYGVLDSGGLPKPAWTAVSRLLHGSSS